MRALQQRDTAASGVEKAEKEKQTVLIPQDNTYRTLAIRAADFQVCVDLFLLSQAYVDVATLSTLCQTTGGSVYRYAPFQPQYDEDQFVNDLRYGDFMSLFMFLHTRSCFLSCTQLICAGMDISSCWYAWIICETDATLATLLNTELVLEFEWKYFS